ncbi:glutamine-hydrolyzing carbamoyl-phosphate synthase small subunit [bacterium]|nr:glutamine-hydrolyzing carbamoyl-phosphate synthase small subunit [bacterium]
MTALVAAASHRRPPAFLALATGDVFAGLAVGKHGTTAGEAVFNTAMTGYQEICSDPSYAGQLVALTYPHIGNVGTTDEDDEAGRPHFAGLILREPPRTPSNWRAQQDLDSYLDGHGIVAIAGIDTRRLTRILREQGAQGAAIVSGPDATADAALAAARDAPSLAGADLAQQVTTAETYSWEQPTWRGDRPALDKHVVVYDFGVKRNILRMLVDAGCKLTVVPAKTPAADVLAMRPDGVMLSNGPGDPEPCDYAIAAARELLAAKMPLMGICLGHQILGLACNAKTVKMKFGHHGANHPVQDKATGRVWISSQNHGFAVDSETLPDNVVVTHVSLFDGSLQGIARTDVPAIGFQGHPEASPGPHDVASLFQEFVALMERA